MTTVCRLSCLLLLSITLAACETTYFNAMEKVGIHKREILVDRIEQAQQAQAEGQAQFKNALEQFRSVVNFDGGELEDLYNRLNDEFERSEAVAGEISERIDKVDSVAEALFDEWGEELNQYSSATLRRDSAKQLQNTQRRYKRLLLAMRKAEKSIDPVLDTLRDNTLYLKHNLNARAISSLKSELSTVNRNVSALIAAMDQAIAESDSFLKQFKNN